MSKDDWDRLFDAARLLGSSITPSSAVGEDATGGSVSSLTEAVMGVTAGLCRVADAIQEAAGYLQELADHIEEPTDERAT